MDLEAALRAYLDNRPRAARRLEAALRLTVLPVFRGRFDDATVEDLVQETALTVFADLHEFEDRGPGSFKAWILQIARNRKLGRVDRDSRQRERDRWGEAILNHPLKPSELLAWRQRWSLVREVLDGVDPVFVRALLHLAVGGDPAELATHEGVKPQTIRTRASRALQILREEIRTRRQSSGRFLATPR